MAHITLARANEIAIEHGSNGVSFFGDELHIEDATGEAGGWNPITYRETPYAQTGGVIYVDAKSLGHALGY